MYIENNNNKTIIINFITRNFNQKLYHLNIYILIKLYYLKYTTNNNVYIPKTLIKRFNETPHCLKFLDIIGCSKNHNFDDDIKSFMRQNMILIPENIIVNYFNYNNSKCVKENEYIENKIDLYISILTYIYYWTYKFNNHFHEKIVLYITDEICTNNNSDIITSLINSKIYNLIDIPNDKIEYFHYAYTDHSHENPLQLFNHYNNNNKNNNINDNTITIPSLVMHHLKTVYNFYNTYILTYFINDEKCLYNDHPLIARIINI